MYYPVTFRFCKQPISLMSDKLVKLLIRKCDSGVMEGYIIVGQNCMAYLKVFTVLRRLLDFKSIAPYTAVHSGK